MAGNWVVPTRGKCIISQRIGNAKQQFSECHDVPLWAPFLPLYLDDLPARSKPRADPRFSSTKSPWMGHSPATKRSGGGARPKGHWPTKLSGMNAGYSRSNVHRALVNSADNNEPICCTYIWAVWAKSRTKATYRRPTCSTLLRIITTEEKINQLEHNPTVVLSRIVLTSRSTDRQQYWESFVAKRNRANTDTRSHNKWIKFWSP